MIIRSQDKKMLINFNNISAIFLKDTEVVVRYYDGCAGIGKYSTKEKAIKVLDMIQDKYTEYTKVASGWNGENIQGLYVLPRGFQMPQDSEVEE